MRSAGSLKWLPGFKTKRVGMPFSRRAATTSSVPCATLRRSRLGVFVSFLPSDTKAHSGGRVIALSRTKRANPGYHSDPDALATRSNAAERACAQTAKSPASEYPAMMRCGRVPVRSAGPVNEGRALSGASGSLGSARAMGEGFAGRVCASASAVCLADAATGARTSASARGMISRSSR